MSDQQNYYYIKKYFLLNMYLIETDIGSIKVEEFKIRIMIMK